MIFYFPYALKILLARCFRKPTKIEINLRKDLELVLIQYEGKERKDLIRMNKNAERGRTHLYLYNFNLEKNVSYCVLAALSSFEFFLSSRILIHSYIYIYTFYIYVYSITC